MMDETLKSIYWCPPLFVFLGVYRDFELSDMARAVAQRQTVAKQAVPHYYLSVEINLKNLLALRGALNKANGGGSGGKKSTATDLSVLDFVVKASALASKQIPDVNGAWMDTFVRRYEQVDINVVMGTGAGLVTPIIRNAGSKGLAAISSEVRVCQISEKIKRSKQELYGYK
jgi:pyruvate dehydrogenase E2 component (dihydrolipoamide acetyltransferase)